ncbi:MAG: GGDEF domain-containing protein [Burkholderiaceae bacterium]
MVVRLVVENVANDWRSLLASVPRPVLEEVARIATTQADVLVEHFYDQMLSDPVASAFLTHDQVRVRLADAMKQWIKTVMTLMPGDDPTAAIELQRRVGDVHARVGVPLHVVLRGARALKQRMGRFLNESRLFDEAQRLVAKVTVSAIMDLAMEAMSSSYAASHDRHQRAEESYRLFAVIHNVEAEKERQRAALYRWEARLCYGIGMGAQPAGWQRLGGSDFGVWFRHKGAHVFQGTDEAGRILALVAEIDAKVADAAGSSTVPVMPPLLREIHEKAHEIRYNLERLFAQYSALESGRDTLTRMLSRKFLPVVMAREMAYARETGTRFSMVLADIDHFKQVNDDYGHDAGDAVLQQFAAIISNVSRAGDYLFRIGGEEFLLLLIDAGTDVALRIAEKLRATVQAEPFRLPRERLLNVTVSLGVAAYDGHPDYELLLSRADQALYQAKQQGRNRVMAYTD